MKEYLTELAWYDYVLFGVYILLFTYFIDRISIVGFRLGKQTTRIMKAIFLVYSVTLIANSMLGFLPEMPDTSLYTYMITTGLYPETSTFNVMAIYYLSIVIGILCLNSPIIFVLFNIFFYLIGCMLLLSAIRPVTASLKSRQQLIMAVMLLIWPAALVFQSVPLREAYIMLAMCVYLTGFMHASDQGKHRYLIIGAIMLILLRVHLIVTLLPVTAILLLYRRKAKPVVQLAVIVAVVAGLLLFFRFVLLGEPLSPEALGNLRNSYLVNLGEQTYGNVEWNTYWDMLRDVPFLTLQFLLSPLPIFSGHDMSTMTFAMIDMCFVLAILAMTIVLLLTHIRRYGDILLLILVFAVVFSLYEFHLTGAVRHRMPVVLMLMIPASGTLAKLTERSAP